MMHQMDKCTFTRLFKFTARQIIVFYILYTDFFALQNIVISLFALANGKDDLFLVTIVLSCDKIMFQILLSQ